MYFHEVKSTAHPPVKGTLGHSTAQHSTDFILKQPNTAAIKFNVCPAILLLSVSKYEKYKNVLCHREHWYGTLWGSGRLTLRNIALTSGTIWGKLAPNGDPTNEKLNLQPEVGNCPKRWCHE